MVLKLRRKEHDGRSLALAYFVLALLAGCADLSKVAGIRGTLTDHREHRASKEIKEITGQHDVPMVRHRESIELAPILVSDVASFRHSFEVTNDSQHVVTFAAVRTSCGCSRADLDKSTLGPGESTVCSLFADLSGRSGRQRFSCFLYTDDNQGWVYEVTTTILPSVEVDPFIVSFGSIAHDGLPQPQRAHLKIRSRKPNEFGRLVEIRHSRAVVVDKGKPVTRTDENGISTQIYQLEISLSPPSGEFGSHRENVILAVAEVDRLRQIDLPVAWSVAAPIIASPARLFFRFNGATDRATGEIELRHAQGVPFRVKQVESTSFPRAVIESVGASAVHRITVGLSPDDFEGQVFVGRLIVYFDGPALPPVIVPVAAMRH